jgi:hypothetical protein
MFFRCLCLAVCFLIPAFAGHAELSKGNQFFIDRGFQAQAIVSTYEPFHLSTLSNANYTAVNWLWNDPRSYNGSTPLLGPAPGFPWGRWVSAEEDMPAKGDEAPYLEQLVTLQLGDEPKLDEPPIRDRFVNWLNSVRDTWPNTILYVNDGGGLIDANLIDFIDRGRPDMMTFDVYPWKSTYDSNTVDHVGVPIGGPPTIWYSVLRIHRDVCGAFNIPFGSYVQTFHAVEEYGPKNVYRDPSPSELRLNHFGALAFNAKMLIDFHYNNGSSPLFVSPGGDSNPAPLYYEKADCNLRCRNLGKTLVRLKPFGDAITPCNAAPLTTSVMFIRGRNASGVLNPIPLNFCAGPAGANPTTDWVYQRNDPYLTGWTVANKGTKNNGQPGDVVLSWFKPLDESFDGPNYTNEIYMMVVNGLTETNGTAADCAQEIKLNFTDSLKAVEMLNPLTGRPEINVLSLTNGVRQLVLNLNGGDAALFKFLDTAPFIGAPFTGPPTIALQPQSCSAAVGGAASFNVVSTGDATLSFQWQFNGTNIAGATASTYTRETVQLADAGNYRVVITNASGSVTSAVAPLTIGIPAALPPLLYEPFDYTNIGGKVSGNTSINWVPAGGGSDDFNVVAGSLSYPGLHRSMGNSATNGGAGVAVRRLIGQTVSAGTVYFSVLFNLVSFAGWSGGSVTSGAQVCALTSSDNSTFRLQVLVKSNTPSTYLIGVQKGGPTSTNTFSATPLNLGETVLLVGKYDFRQKPNPVTLWINPSPSTLANSEPASGFITNSTGSDDLGIDRFNFRQNVLTGANSVPGFMQWDELRVGTNWTSVTPVRIQPGFVPSAILLSENTVQWHATGDMGTVIVEESTNLTTWNEITNVFSANGVFDFTESTANHPRRFYRLKLSP